MHFLLKNLNKADVNTFLKDFLRNLSYYLD